MKILGGDFFNFQCSILLHAPDNLCQQFFNHNNFKEAKKECPMHNDTLKELVLPRMH